MRRGRLEMDGSSEAVIARHHELLSQSSDLAATDGLDSTGEEPAPMIEIVSRQLTDAAGPTHHPGGGDSLNYRVTFRFNSPVDSPQFFFRVTSEDGVICYQMETVLGREWRRVEAGETVTTDIAFTARLGGGTYRLTMTVSDCRAQPRPPHRSGWPSDVHCAAPWDDGFGRPRGHHRGRRS